MLALLILDSNLNITYYVYLVFCAHQTHLNFLSTRIAIINRSTYMLKVSQFINLLLFLLGIMKIRNTVSVISNFKINNKNSTWFINGVTFYTNLFSETNKKTLYSSLNSASIINSFVTQHSLNPQRFNN